MAFPTNCNPRIISVDDSCGCTLTRASITPMTKQLFEDQALREVGMDKVIAATKEARMVGVKESTLMDLLLSRHVPLKAGTVPMVGQSVIAPFVYRPQRHNVNANYFRVNVGSATAGAGTGSIPASAWTVTVENTGAQFATTLVNLQKYFSPGHFVTILYKDNLAGNVGRTIQFKVLTSTNADAGGVSKARLSLEPNISAATWATYNSTQKRPYQPTHGILIPMANSISDYESWCNNRPSENTMKLLTFWLQTIRETHCYNDEYLKALNAQHTSEYFKKFRELPLALQKKRQAYLADLAYYNTIFYGQAISDLQADTTYTSLPQVTDPANAECVLEYKSNTIGIRQQLSDCGRVTDFEGGQLDLDTIKAIGYAVKRNREIDSGTIDRIDVMTDRYTRSNIKGKMIEYYQKRYGMNTTRFYQVDQKLTFDNIGLMSFDLYDFEDEGFQLAVFSDNYFDDKLAAFGNDGMVDKSRGRAIWGIDWSDIEIGLVKARSVARQTNVADNLYNCVIQPNVNHYNLTSKTIAVMVQDPNRHMLFENFSNACPDITIAGCYRS